MIPEAQIYSDVKPWSNSAESVKITQAPDTAHVQGYLSVTMSDNR